MMKPLFPKIHGQPLILSSHADILSDQVAGITVFLPANDAINTTLNKFGLDLKGLLQNQHLCTEIVQYHILPSPIEVRNCSSAQALSCCIVP